MSADLFREVPVPRTMTQLFIGHPAPGGSKNVLPLWRKDGSCVRSWKGAREWPAFRVIDAGGAGNTRWKEAVACQARAWMKGAVPFECPLEVYFTFWIRRPQGHYRTGKFAHLLRDDAPEFHTVMPDALKLARSTEDAMTGIVWKDDAQNVVLSSCKRYKAEGEQEGVTVKMIILE